MHAPLANRVSLLRGALLLLFAGVIVGLFLQGNLDLYIHPRFIPYTLGAALVLALMGLGQWREFRRSAGRVPRGVWGVTLVFLVPVLLMLVPRATLGANLAAQQGINLTNRGTAAGSPGAVQATSKDVVATIGGRQLTADATFRAWIQDVYAHPEPYVGKPVTMTGFLFRPEGVPAPQFMVSRLIVTCHIAHATADGLLVIPPPGVELYEDAWYEVEGVLVQDTYQGKPVLKIQAQRVTAVLMPAEPYIFG